MTKKYTPQQILALPLDDNDAGAATIGHYFAKLAHKVWAEVEYFSGKKPFGNSGWESDIEDALIKAEAVTGRLDKDGNVIDVNLLEVANVLNSVFDFLCNADWSTLKEIEPPKEYYIADFHNLNKGWDDTPEIVSIAMTKADAEAEYRTDYDRPINSDRDYRIIRIESYTPNN